MNEKMARERLKDSIQPDGTLYDLGWYLAWGNDETEGTLDGTFTVDDLEAIVWWVRNAERR